jgi:hypothetical protein
MHSLRSAAGAHLSKRDEERDVKVEDDITVGHVGSTWNSWTSRVTARRVCAVAVPGIQPR